MIRAKITPTRDETGVHVLIEWVEVCNERVGAVIYSEQFRIENHRQGSAYISKVAVEQATEMGGTFWLDENGLRHFITVIDPGTVGAFGNEIG